ncbi:hypothetical protein OH77DRAFT_1428245 [Trametes cingulata]|nr:hypothetical protein OH77DRAFT_1428245 [Trametes cingulata]
MTLGREPLWHAGSWALKRLSPNEILIERWETRTFVEGPLDLMQVVTHSWFLGLTHLNLSLDSMDAREYHGHRLYLSWSATNAGTPLNAATELEIVQLCQYLRRTLVSLTISMCKPELVVPHIPRLVYDIVDGCPELQYLMVRDIQCDELVGCLPTVRLLVVGHLLS